MQKHINTHRLEDINKSTWIANYIFMIFIILESCKYRNLC